MFAGIVSAVGRIVSAEAHGDGLRLRVEAEEFGLAAGREVNLEKSLRLADRIDGHMVSGHVDGVGKVTAFEELGGSARLEIEAPAGLARYIARKGSIAVDGVSLTVNAVSGSRFEVNVIPHSRAVTTLGGLVLGAPVNLEVDMIARYVERLAAFGAQK